MAPLLQDDQLLESGEGLVGGVEVALCGELMFDEGGVGPGEFPEEGGEVFGEFGLHNFNYADQLQLLRLDYHLCHNRICCRIL